MKVIPERLRRHKGRSGTMTVFEHLDELRKRLIITVLAVLAGSIIGWFLFGPAVHILTKPFCTFMTAHPQLAARPTDPCRLVYGGPLEPFVTKLKVTVFLGFALSLPVVLYEFWRFVTPGLMPNERKLALPFVLTSIALFLFGAWFALVHPAQGDGVPARLRRHHPCPAPADLRQVSGVRHPHHRGIRGVVRVPPRADLPDRWSGCSAAKSCGRGAGTPSWGSPCSPRSSRRARTGSP